MNSLPSVAIPTYGRANLIAKRTLKFLHDVGYPKDKITLFVVAAEEEKYRQIDPNLYGSVIVGELGLKEQRNFISKYYPEGSFLICMDDDVKRIDIEGDFKDYVLKALERMVKEGAGLYGVLPKDDGRCYKDSYTTHLSHILGSFFICINHHDIVITHTDKEDYERSILYFIKYGKVIRDRSGGVSTTYGKGTGGLQTEGREERMKLDTENLVLKYPEFCKSIVKRGMADIALNWRVKSRIDISEFSLIIAELKRKPLDINKYRLKVGQGRSQCFGIVGKRCMPPNISRQSWRNPYLHHLLMEFAKKHINIPFTSIQVNQNMTCAAHFDKGNIGVSAIVAFGDYSGGELIVEGVKHDIKNKIFLFDGSAQEHYTAPFTGERYSLVYHTIAPQERWGWVVPSILDYEAVMHDGIWKMKRLIDGEMFWGTKKGLPHPLLGFVRN